MHHDPLDAGCGAVRSAFFPPPRKMVTTPASELSLPCKDLGSNGLTSLSIVTVGGAPLTRESAGGVSGVASAAGSAGAGTSALTDTRLRRLSDNLPISLARAMISLCFGVTS